MHPGGPCCSNRVKPEPLSRTAGVIVVACLALAACSQPPTDARDPRGTDASFHFSWRINGQDPASASDPCTAAGVRFVRMSVVTAGEAPQPVDAFDFDCHLGSYTSAHPELRAGTYRLFWEALAPDGTRRSVAAGTFGPDGRVNPALESLTVPPSGLVDFDATNRPDVTFPPSSTNFATGSGPLRATFAWAAHPGDAAGPTCSVAQVSGVTWTLRRSNGAVADARTAPALCADGYNAVQWDTLEFDRYTLEANGFDAAGTQRYRGRCTDLAVTSAGPAPERVTCVVDPI